MLWWANLYFYFAIHWFFVVLQDTISIEQSWDELIGTALPVTVPVTHVAPWEDEFPTFAFNVY